MQACSPLTLSEILTFSETAEVTQFDGQQTPPNLSSLPEQPGVTQCPESISQQRPKAEREWHGAVAALNVLLREGCDAQVAANPDEPSCQGVLLSGPLPVLSHPTLLRSFSTWLFAVKHRQTTTPSLPRQLLPANRNDQQSQETTATLSRLPLLPDDPLGTEQFCVALTPHFSLAIVLGTNAAGEAALRFSFDPSVIYLVWQVLRSRVLWQTPQRLPELDRLVQQFPPIAPDYRTVAQFSRLLLRYLPEPVDLGSKRGPVSGLSSSPEPLHTHGARLHQQKPRRPEASTEAVKPQSSPVAWDSLADLGISPDVALLQAIAHEVRTPLTTIRTLIQMLLKRRDLMPEVARRLEAIDSECSEQIDRFGLIFRAAELETQTVKKSAMPLTPTPLAQVLQQSIPRWQKRASRRNLTLDVILPRRMPNVVSDPVMLDQALTGLIDRYTRQLPASSHIEVQVCLAGSQLKLQLQTLSQSPENDRVASPTPPTLQSLGHLLAFQPETGSLSLNMAVTKNLFQALGGKLIVRQRPQQGEVLTVFLPLDVNSRPLA